MKKTFAILLAFVMIFTLFACGNEAALTQTGGETKQDSQSSNSLMVGFDKQNITPEEAVPLSGSANRGNSSGMLDYLYATCLAISDGENTALIFGMDIQNAYSPTSSWRNAVSRATDIPEERIQICFTHTHSAPNTGSDAPSISRYNTMVSERMVKAAKNAVKDLKAAQATIAQIETENMNFVRRYLMNDGSLCGDNWGTMASGIKSHETEVDSELQVIRFTREGGDDVILANFQMHSNYTIGGVQISSDVAGAFRDALENKSGVNVLYLNGASGNINPTSRIPEENVVKTHREWGEKMATYAMRALENSQDAKLSTLKTSQVILDVPTNHMFDDLYESAVEINNYFKNGGERAVADQMCAEAGISSVYHADAIVANKGRGMTTTVELDVYSVGDVAFIFAPVEMFDTNGMQIKDGSPYAMTFICGYANHCQGYMPSQAAYANLGYEVATSSFGEGAAEKVVEEFFSMLNQMKADDKE